MVATLAAAYAESARFPEAIASAQKARQLALTASQKDAAAKAEDLLKQFQAGQPYRD